MTADRNSTYAKFGPILLEAVCLVIHDQINILQHNQGMPEITEQDILDNLNNHLSELQPCDWMKNF